MFAELIAILSLIVAITSNCLTWYIYKSKDRKLEHDEVRKRKVEIVYQLLGARYVASDGYPASSDEVKSFNTALALLPIYFSDSPNVLKIYDRFVASKSDDNLASMLQIAADEAGFSITDSIVRRVVTVMPKTVQSGVSRAPTTGGKR